MNKKLLFLCFTCLTFTHLFAQWTSAGGPDGGVVFALAKVNNELWAGTEGGLYTSPDDGLSWNRNALIRPEDNVRSIAVFPGEILLGVIHFDYDGYSANPQFLCYRSTDGGATFIQTELPFFNWNNDLGNFYRNGTTLFCNAQSQWAKSTDNGQTWTAITFPDGMYAMAAAVNGDRMVAANYYAVWRSENGGDTWTFLDSLSYIDGFYLEGDLVLATTAGDNFYRSTDFGLHWQTDSLNPIHFAASLRRGNQGELWKPGPAIVHSFDDGLTWSALTFADSAYHGYYDALQDGNDYLAATDLGVIRTVNGSWVERNNNLKISRIYALRSNKQGRLSASTNVGAFTTDDGGLHWQKLPTYNYAEGPSAYDDAILEGDTMLVLSNYKVWRSVDAGQTWATVIDQNLNFADYLAQQNGIIYVPANDSVYYSADFGLTWQSFTIAENIYGWYDDIVVVDNRALVITNDGDIFRSTDNFVTWTKVHTIYSPGAYNDNRLSYLGNRIYAFGRLETFYSADGGDTWQQVLSQGLPLTQFGDPLQPSQFLVADNLLFAAVPYNGVYVSSDAGNHWEPLNDGLENLRGRSLALHNQRLYLGTSTGGVYQYDSQFESVTGTIYNDLNDNGVQDAGEPPLSNILVAAEPLHSYTQSGNGGSYGLLAESFADTLRAVANSPYATVHPAYYVVSQAGTDFNFGIHYTPGIQDLSIIATNPIVFRPGFPSRIVVTARNIGTAAAGPATVKLLLPAGLSYYNAYPVPTQSGDTLTWSIGVLAALESRNIDVDVQCSTDLVNGQLLDVNAFIYPLNDADPVNNQYSYREPVVGSYDPNDKQVRPSNGITPTQIAQGDRLEYTIRFENTGNYAADFVRILDTLSARVDVASLEIIAASHPVTWSVKGNGIVEFNFKDIFLLPSSFGNGEGHGFVKYAVRCRPGTPLNADIRNTAYIFFDFNPPVQTNTTSTIVKTSVGTHAPELTGSLEVSPNPASDYVVLSWSQPPGAGRIRLYGTDGGLVFSQPLRSADRQLRVALPALPAGSYQLVWQGANQTAVIRSIQVAH